MKTTNLKGKTKKVRVTKQQAKSANIIIVDNWTPSRRSTSYVYDEFQLDKLKVGNSIHLTVNNPLFNSAKGCVSKFNRQHTDKKLSLYVLKDNNEKVIKHVIYRAI